MLCVLCDTHDFVQAFADFYNTNIGRSVAGKDEMVLWEYDAPPPGEVNTNPPTPAKALVRNNRREYVAPSPESLSPTPHLQEGNEIGIERSASPLSALLAGHSASYAGRTLVC